MDGVGRLDQLSLSNRHAICTKAGQILFISQFWAAYVGCSSQYKDSVQVFLEQIDLIRRMVAAYPDQLVFAKTADDVEGSFRHVHIFSICNLYVHLTTAWDGIF